MLSGMGFARGVIDSTLAARAPAAGRDVRRAIIAAMSSVGNHGSKEVGADFARPPRLDALTSLRFVAAAAIVVLHTGDLFAPAPGTTLVYALNGGLSFFFVLSGFVLAYNYPRLDAPGATATFLVLRFARLWPLHVAGFAAMLALSPPAAWVLPGIDPALAAVLNLTLLQSWVPVPGYAVSFNGPSWTLSVDVFFYAAFPVLIVAMHRAPVAAFVAAVLVSLGCAWAAQTLPAPASSDLAAWNAHMLARFFPPARLVEFAAGMLAARAYASRPARPANGIRGTLVEVAVLAATAAALAQLHGMLSLAARVGPGIADWLAQVAAAPVLAAALVVIARRAGAISRALSTRAAVHLGDLSYATYLLHMPLLHAAGWSALVAALGRPLAGAVFWLALLVAAHITWRWIETPARRALVGAWRRRRERPVAAPAQAD
jgi:peptidoglycan/LPS O-acetylase OafA/YrhL